MGNETLTEGLLTAKPAATLALRDYINSLVEGSLTSIQMYLPGGTDP